MIVDTKVLTKTQMNQITALFAAQDKPDSPGAALAIIQNGEVVLRYCFGLANLEHHVPIAPSTRFHIVSMTKMFTAAAILILQAQGGLNLDDDIRKFIPEMPNSLFQSGSISVRHLLSMTSGLRDGLEIMRLRGVWRPSPQREVDILDLAYNQEKVSFPVGERFVYTNTNFVLLAEIIRRVTDYPADEFRKLAIYDKLGMTATVSRDSDDRVVPDLASGYIPKSGGGFYEGANLLGISGDVLVSNLEDMIKWVFTLRDGQIDGVPITAQMAEPMTLKDNTQIYYGLGLAIRWYRGLRILGHSGLQPGYKAHLAYIPERDIGFVMLSNHEAINPSDRMIDIAEILLVDQFPEEHPAQRTFHQHIELKNSADKVVSLDGVYIDPASGEVLSLKQQDNVLHGDAFGVLLTLYPDREGGFVDSADYKATMPVSVSFEIGENLENVVCIANLGGGKGRFKRQPSITLTAEELADYLGRYESDEIASVHTISLRPSGTLSIQYGLGFDRALTFDMKPIALDIFLVCPTAPGVAYQHLFRFQRNEAGKVVSVLVSMARLKNVKLIRTDSK